MRVLGPKDGEPVLVRDFLFPAREKRTENLRVEKLPLAGCEPAAKRAFEVSIQVGRNGPRLRRDKAHTCKAHTCESQHGYLGALGMTFSLASAPGGGVVMHVFRARSAGLGPGAMGVTCLAPLGDGCS